MRITKWGEYGILCSLYLARKESGIAVGAAEIAETQGIPVQYTQQILQRLRKGEVIHSVRGPHGGYALSRPPAQTTLRQILAAAEGDTFEIICDSNPIYPDACDNNNGCGLRTVWQDLKLAIDQLLDSRSLAWVMEQEERNRGSTEAFLVPGPRKVIGAIASETLVKELLKS